MDLLSQMATEFWKCAVRATSEGMTRRTHLLPSETDLQIVVELGEVKQVLEDRVRFVLGHTNDPLGEVRVHEDGLPAGDWVGSRISNVSANIKGIFD